MIIDGKKCVVYTNKKNGARYVVENQPYWDKEKKQGRSKRIYIGSLDRETGEFVPSKGRNSKKTEPKSIKSTTATPPTELPIRSFYGATYLFDEICKKLGIIEDLKYCFPDNFKQILSIAYYLILEDNNPLSRFGKWGHLHHHPYGRDIPSQRSSDLFAAISDVAVSKFFKLQSRRYEDDEYLLYDITTISSYSQVLRKVQYGHNKENDRLPQLNLAFVYGEKSNLPFYYRLLPGNIPDVKTLKPLLAELHEHGYKKVKLVMDRGFYSEDNVNSLYKSRDKFLIAGKKSIVKIQKYIDSVQHNIHEFQHYNDDFTLNGTTIETEWDYTETHSKTGKKIKSKKPIFVHIFYNSMKALESEQQLNKKLTNVSRKLQSGKTLNDSEESYIKYFEVNKGIDGKINVQIKNDVIKETKKYYGYFILLSNEIKDTWKALTFYRNRDIVEKAYNNFKERLNMRRMLVSSEVSLNGKLFVGFISLIILSYINKQMSKQGMYKDYTLQDMLDKLDVIECYKYEGKKLRIGEILEKQKQIYRNLDVKIPEHS